MGHANSRQVTHNDRSKCLDFPKRSPCQSLPTVRTRIENDVLGGLNLSWLVAQHVASLNGDGRSTVRRVMEDVILPLTSAESTSDAFGPATHVVLVHPSTPWSAFIKAILNHVGMDPKKALLAGDALLSPRSPLVAFGPSAACHFQHAGAGCKLADIEPWTYHGAQMASADHLYHTTYLHIDFLARTFAALPSSTYLDSPLPAASAAAAVSATCAASGDMAEHALGRMAGEAAALLVVDPAGAIFLDPLAIRAIAATIAVLRQVGAHVKDLHQHQHQQQQQQRGPVAACCDGGGGINRQPPRLQLASCLEGGDWAPVAAAFSRVAGLLPDDPAAVREAVLESAQLQYSYHSPLFHVSSCGNPSTALEAECGCCAAICNAGSATTAAAGSGIDIATGGGGGGIGIRLPRAQRHVLPGQIETAEKLAIAGDIGQEDGGNADGGREDGGAGGCGSGRGRGPDSQSGIARFARDLFASGMSPMSPPAVPPADAADVLSLVRRSRSLLMENGITVCTASARHKLSAGKSSSSLVATPPSAAAVGVNGAAAEAVASGACSPLPRGNGGAVSVQHSVRGGGVLSTTNAHVVVSSGAGSVGAGCLSNPNVATVAMQQGICCSYMHYASAMASASSSTGVCPEGTSHLVPFAVEAARRYAALLEAVGLCATASGVLGACLCVAGGRWGHRSSRMAALLTQLGRLQQMQGLYRTAEVTWRQALEALECIHGADGLPVLQCRVALAQVLAALQDGEAETLMRGALAGLDTALGPTAKETLAARAAVAGFLAQSCRWAEAEVAYQALLQVMETAPPPPSASPRRAQPSEILSAGIAGGSSAQQRRQGGSGGAGVSVQQQLLLAGTAAVQGQTEQASSTVALMSSPSAVAPRKTDSSSRTAWASRTVWDPDAFSSATAAVAATAVDISGALPIAIPCSPVHGGGGGGGSFHSKSASSQRTVLPPLRSSGSTPSVTSITIPLSVLLPLPSLRGDNSGATSAEAAEPSALGQGDGGADGSGGDGNGSAGGGLGPGNADVLAWSTTAAALADVIVAVHRDLDGVNELYSGMHLAGPEGSMAADLAALAAVCPRSGACITAVANVRRLTDPGMLYDAALAAQRAALDATHPVALVLQMQYALHLSAVGEHNRAEAVCRSALERLMLAPPAGYRRCFGAQGSETANGNSRGGRHPAEVGLRRTLGAVLLSAGSLAAAAAELTSAVDLAEALVAAGDMVAADTRRVEALESLSEALWQCAQPTQTAAAGAADAQVTASVTSMSAGSSLFISRAIECKRQALELMASVCGERHERMMAGWVALGQMLEAAGDLAAAERAFECAADVALHRHSRLSAATKAIFRELQRVYQAQGRTADAQVLGHMYRLKGGLLSMAAAAAPSVAAPVQA